MTPAPRAWSEAPVKRPSRWKTHIHPFKIRHVGLVTAMIGIIAIVVTALCYLLLSEVDFVWLVRGSIIGGLLFIDGTFVFFTIKDNL